MRRRALLAAVASASIIVSGLIAAPAATAADTVTASQLPALLTGRAEDTAHDYVRDRFEHWIDADANGCNTRYEVLISESTTPVAVARTARTPAAPGCRRTMA
ncbi:hypothetical protein [Microbacterium sp. PRC9]|uniref:hypothetical protein n=1 Tax=Microbacterium sp. PRC9 TaxID=2962591 RepID=UPI002881FAD6|nr:hypothetical protein [Microbacterium sp. PRC9]MDT0141471.1 hypothetical protein [Microbacterium sp. PRC9]